MNQKEINTEGNWTSDMGSALAPFTNPAYLFPDG